MSIFHSAASRLAALIWLGGMLGVVALIGLDLPKVIPELLEGRDAGITTSTLQWVAAAQAALLLALAAWAGMKTASVVGLRAPTLEAIATGRSVRPFLIQQLRVGLGYGVLCGLFLFTVNAVGPDAWIEAQTGYYPSLLTRLLFGGFTEEVLLRWGLMSTFVWLLWRSSRTHGEPARASHMWIGIIAVAVLFGVLHLPAVGNAVGSLDAYLVLYIVGANAAAGTVFGWLFWRHGLETAIIAHALAHLVNYLLGLL